MISVFDIMFIGGDFMEFGNKVIGIAIAVFITIALLIMVQGSIASAIVPAVYDCGVDTICGGANAGDDTLITAAGAFNGSATGTLMTLIPLIVVAGLLGAVYLKRRK